MSSGKADSDWSFSALISCGNDMDIARESERTSSMTTAHSDEPANIILNPAVFDERERVLASSHW